jgi:hypothetical protein
MKILWHKKNLLAMKIASPVLAGSQDALACGYRFPAVAVLSHL